MNRVFIVNPVAGEGKGLELIPLIKKLFPDGIIRRTEYPSYGNQPSHATLLAHEYSKPNTKIYSVGGDGTANEIVNGILGGIPLSIINAGSGNDTIKSLTNIKTPEEILSLESKKVAEGNENIRRMDLGIVRFRNDYSCLLEDMYFLNVVSIGGIDAKVGELANNYKKKEGEDPSDIYKKSVIPALISFKAPHIKVSIYDKRVLDQRVTLFAICNGGFYGGKFNVAPQASITDGIFNICYVDKISKLRLPFLMPSLERGEHGKYKEFVHFDEARSLIEQNSPLVRIESDKPIVSNIDGQPKKSDIYEVDNIHQGLLISTPEFKVLKKVA